MGDWEMVGHDISLDAFDGLWLARCFVCCLNA